MPRIAKVLLGLLASVVALVGGAFGLAWLFLDLDALIHRQIAEHQPEVEATLGRKLSIGAVKTSLFPTLGAQVSDIAIAADPNRKEDDQPLLQIGSVGFSISLWDALASRGKTIRVKEVHLDRLQVSLVRFADGTLSHQSILDRQAAQPAEPKAAAKDEPMDPATLELLRTAVIGEVRIGDARIRLRDFATPSGKVAESVVDHLNIRLADVNLAKAIGVHLDAAVFSQATNLTFDTSVGPLPADLKLSGAPDLGETRIKLTAVELAPLAPYLGKSPLARIEKATATVDERIGPMKPGQPFELEGELDVKAVQLPGGKPFDLHLGQNVKFDPASVSLDVAKLDFGLGTIALGARGALKDLATAPRFEKFEVASTTLSADVLFSHIPDARKGLPEGFVAHGTGRLDVIATGSAAAQDVKAIVDLGAMELVIPGALTKPSGVALSARVEGSFAGKDATVRAFGVVLDQLELLVKGTVKNFSAPTLDLALEAKPFPFDRLARLLPGLKAGLESSKTSAAGQLEVTGKAKGTLTALDAALHLGLVGARIEVPGTKVHGDVVLDAKLSGDPGADFAATVALRGTPAQLVVQGSVDKAAGVPLELDLDLARKGKVIDVKQARLELAELKAKASGQLDQGSGNTKLDLDLAPLDLERFARTVTAIPAGKARGGIVDVKLAASGDPKALATMRLAIKPMNVRYAGSDLHGEATIDNLAVPKVTLTTTSDLLDLDAMFPPAEGDAAKPKDEGQKAPAADDPSLRAYEAHLDLSAKRLITSQTELTGFRGVVDLVDGLLTVKQAGFGVYDGRVKADGTTAEIWRGRMPFTAKLAITDIDVNKALSAKTKYRDLLFGKGNFDTDLTGVGFETPDLEKALSGTIGFALADARWSAKSLTGDLDGSLGALNKVPGLKLEKLQGENRLKDAKGTLTVKDGKVALQKPLETQLDGEKVRVEGAFGIAGGLFMKGTLLLRPETLSKLTFGKCTSTEPAPIPFDLGGTVSAPTFRPDMGGLASTLISTCLKAQALDALKNATGIDAAAAIDKGKQLAADAEAKARAEADRLKQQAEAQRAEVEAKARAEADRLKAEAEAKRQEAEAKARAEADRVKKEAEDRAKAEADKKKKEAEDAAKNKAKGLLNGFKR